MDIQKEREDFEKLWTDGNGHFKFFEFDQDACKYRLNGVTDNLSKEDLLSASITLNTAWLFWLGAKKRAVPEVITIGNELQSWVSVNSFSADDGDGVLPVVDANAIAEKIEELTGANQ